MQTIQEILNKFGNDTINIIRSNMDRAGQNATGDTANALRSQLIGDQRLQVSGPAHIWVLEKGRGPYKGGAAAGLASKLERWLQAKNIPIRKSLEKDAKSLAYLINKFGTKLYQDGGRTDIITPAISDDRIDEVVKEVADLKTKVFADAFTE